MNYLEPLPVQRETSQHTLKPGSRGPGGKQILEYWVSVMSITLQRRPCLQRIIKSPFPSFFLSSICPSNMAPWVPNWTLTRCFHSVVYHSAGPSRIGTPFLIPFGSSFPHHGCCWGRNYAFIGSKCFPCNETTKNLQGSAGKSV